MYLCCRKGYIINSVAACGCTIRFWSRIVGTRTYEALTCTGTPPHRTALGSCFDSRVYLIRAPMLSWIVSMIPSSFPSSLYLFYRNLYQTNAKDSIRVLHYAYPMKSIFNSGVYQSKCHGRMLAVNEYLLTRKSRRNEKIQKEIGLRRCGNMA